MNLRLSFLVLVVGPLGTVTWSVAQTDAASPSGAAVAQPAVSAARIAFAQPTFDFGKIESGEPVKHDFVFTNTGNQTLEIREVRPGCGCTTAGSWDKLVEPGKTGTIPVQFNSAGYGGSVQKAISVTCNDPTQANVTLQLKGTVWKPIDATPTYAMFNLGPDVQTNTTIVIKIVNNLEDPVTVSDPSSSSPAFRTELKTVKEGKEYELHVTVVPPVDQPSVSAPITLKTSYPKMPVLNVTAFAMVQPPVAVMPAQITLPPGPLGHVMEPVITIQNNSTNSLALSEPTISVPGAEARLKETQPGRQFNLTLSFPSGFQSHPGEAIEARVKSNNPRLPLIKVPVFQTPSSAGTAPAPASPSAPAAGTAVANAPPQSKPLPSSSSPVSSASVEAAPGVALAASEQRGGGAAIQFALTAFDFGRVESGKVVTHDFVFTNTGDQTLVITDVRSSCGCTAATNWNRPVEPGKTGTIPVLFNTGGMAGPVAKTLWVSCNDTRGSNVLLQISALVWKPIDVLPGIATFSFGPDFQTNQTRSIRLVSNLDDPVTISDPVCTNQAFRAELKTVRAGREFELRVTVIPPLGPGGLAVPITMATSSPKMPVVTVSAYAMVQPSLTVMPPRISLPAAPLAQATPFKVVVQNRSTNALLLSETSINARDAEVQLRELQPGRLFNLIVTFPAGFRVPPGQKIEARMKSNHPQFPYLTVPVFQPESPEPEAPSTGTGSSSAQASPKAAQPIALTK